MAEVALRVPTAEDASAWCELFDDAEVMRFIGDGRTRGLEYYVGLVERQRRLAEASGLCLFSVVVSERVVGFAGVQPWGQPWGPNGELEVGWRLGRASWGHGHASAAARAAVERARGSGVGRLVAMIQEGNAASFGVARRLGMVAEQEYVSPEGARVHQLGLTLTA